MEYLFYILESILCCGLFYALYKLFVEGRVVHRFSAWFIILTALLSLIIPALEIPLYPAQIAPEVSSATQILTEPAMTFPTDAAPQTTLSAVIDGDRLYYNSFGVIRNYCVAQSLASGVELVSSA